MWRLAHEQTSVAPQHFEFRASVRNCFRSTAEGSRLRARSRALLQVMTIYRLLANTAFGPEEIERLVHAYEQTLRALV